MSHSLLKIPNGLGLLVAGASLRQVIDGLGTVARHGFQEVQINLSWHPYAAEDLHRLALILRERSLRCSAVGVYCDLLQAESHHFFDTSCQQIRELLPQLSSIGAGLIVVWSGSYADNLLADDPRNHSEEVKWQLQQNVETLAPLLRAYNARLVIEPWKTHVLGDATSLADFCNANSGIASAVLDVPNVLDPRDWPNRKEKSVELIRALQDCAGIAHLKDMTVKGGGSFELPGPGLGEMDYDTILQALKPLWRKVPFVIEHVSEQQIDSVARFVIDGMCAQGYES